MNGRDYRAKFAAYYDYRDSGRYERDYEQFPAVLVVTTGPGPEERIAKALRATAVGREPPLPVLLTTTQWARANGHGLLGPIWRGASSTERRRWPSVTPSRAPTPEGRGTDETIGGSR